jgi:hypothetical protein
VTGRSIRPATPLLDRIFLVCGLIMLVDLAFFGAGLLLPVIGFSLRRLLFMVIVLVATLRRLISRRPFTRAEVALVLLIMVLVALWTVVLPASYGYSIGVAFNDVSPWLGLVLLAIWPWDAWPAEVQWHRFHRFIVKLAVILAIAHIVFLLLLVTDVTSPVLLMAATSLLPTSLGEDAVFLNISALPSGLFRIYWSSSIFLMGGLYFLIAYRPARLTRSWVLALILIGMALFITYIRSFLAAAILFLVLPWLLRFVSSSGAAVSPRLKVLAMWTIGVALVCVAIDPSVLGALQLSREASDVERVDQANALLGQFATHPILGTGFGSYVSQHVRVSELPSAYELVFHALLMKVGILGMLLLVAILGVALDIAGISAHARANPRMFATWAAFTTGFWFAGATNPVVTNFIGIAIILLVLVDVRYWGSQTGVSA